MGVVFIVPLIYLSVRGYIKRRLGRVLLAVSLLGVCQGGIGWWMVQSGLERKQAYQTRAKVSTYRLAAHLSLALTIYSLLFYQALNCLLTQTYFYQNGLLNSLQQIRNARRLRKFVFPLISAIILNLLSGALVAGIEAGRLYNTWPTMNGYIIPPKYLQVFYTNYTHHIILLFNYTLLYYYIIKINGFTYLSNLYFNYIIIITL